MKVDCTRNNVNFTSLMPMVILKDGAPIVLESEAVEIVTMLSDCLKHSNYRLSKAAKIQEEFRIHDRAFCDSYEHFIGINPNAKNPIYKNTIRGILDNGKMYLATGVHSNRLGDLASRIGVLKSQIKKAKERIPALEENYHNVVDNFKKLTAKYVDSAINIRVTESFNPKTRECIGSPVELIVKTIEKKSSGGKSTLIIDSVEFVKDGTTWQQAVFPKQRGLKTVLPVPQPTESKIEKTPKPLRSEAAVLKLPKHKTTTPGKSKKSHKSGSDSSQLELKF